VAADSVIRDMKNKGFKPDETSYSLLIQCYSKSDNLKGIVEIEKEIYSGNIYLTWAILRTLVIANLKCRSLDGTERAFHEIQKKGYRSDLVILNSMLSIYAKHGLFDKGNEIFSVIKKMGTNLVS
jgi:pentatricopeptide repeat domain-containing protein 1